MIKTPSFYPWWQLLDVCLAAPTVTGKGHHMVEPKTKHFSHCKNHRSSWPNKTQDSERLTRISNHAYKKSAKTQIYIIDNLITNPQFIGSRQTHRQRGLHRIDLHEDHGELCIEDPRERRSHLATNYGPVGLKWTTHESLEGRWCWWRSPPTPKSPPAGHREGSPDEISRKRKLAAAEKYFRGSPDFFLIFREYIGARSRSGGRQGGHKLAHRRLPPGGGVGACGLPGALLAWPTGPLIFFRSGKNHFGDFIPFGLRSKIRSEKSQKHRKNRNWHLALN